MRGLLECDPKVTEACRAAVLACVERSTNSEGRIVEVNPFADFFSKAVCEYYFYTASLAILHHMDDWVCAKITWN